ncbi:hypothetical protein HK101_002992 [Irineochytrium annulatum]|nr:hypothetical protein HK101_002992 [Irineochytrium annulatum]
MRPEGKPGKAREGFAKDEALELLGDDSGPHPYPVAVAAVYCPAVTMVAIVATSQEFYTRCFTHSCTCLSTAMIPFFAPLASALVLAGLVRSQPPIQQLQWGLPDFVPDAEYLAATLAMDTVNADSDPCLANEGCLSGTGVRRVLRFGTKIHNYGTSDAHLGLPPDDTTNTTIPYWHFDTCHNHWHFTAYAHYSLVPPVGATPLAGAVTLPTVHGRKSGFCLEDAECPDGLDMRYHCGDQGITRGCADVYGANLPCQWIDVTGLMASPAFNSSDVYTLRVVVNGDGFFPETRGDNNVAEAKVVFDNLGEYEHHHHYHHEVEEAAQVSQVMGTPTGVTAIIAAITTAMGTATITTAAETAIVTVTGTVNEMAAGTAGGMVADTGVEMATGTAIGMAEGVVRGRDGGGIRTETGTVGQE